MEPVLDKHSLIAYIGKKPVPGIGTMFMATSGRLGVIMSNISLILLLISGLMALSAVLSVLFAALFAVVIVFIIILLVVFTFGLIFLADSLEISNLFSLIENTGKFSVTFGEWSLRIAPFVLATSIILAFSSLAFLFADRTKKHIASKIISALTVLGVILVGVIILIGVLV